MSDPINDAIGATAGVIPLVLVAGAATKMTDHMFRQETRQRNRSGKKSMKRQNNSYLRKAQKALGVI